MRNRKGQDRIQEWFGGRRYGRWAEGINRRTTGKRRREREKKKGAEHNWEQSNMKPRPSPVTTLGTIATNSRLVRRMDRSTKERVDSKRPTGDKLRGQKREQGQGQEGEEERAPEGRSQQGSLSPNAVTFEFSSTHTGTRDEDAGGIRV